MELASDVRYSVLHEKSSEINLNRMNSAQDSNPDIELKNSGQDLDDLVLQTLPSVDYSSVSTEKFSLKTRYLFEKILLLTIIVLLFVIFLLTFLSINYKKNLEKSNNFCNTDRCLIVSSSMYKSLNTHVDPCDNFYEYACGGWIKKNLIPTGFPRWGTLNIVTYENNLLIKEQLEANTSTGTNFTNAEIKAKNFYLSCMDKNSTIEKLGSQPLMKILNKLMYKNKSNKLIVNESFVDLLQMVQINYGLNSLFEYNVLDDDQNSSFSNIEVYFLFIYLRLHINFQFNF